MKEDSQKSPSKVSVKTKKLQSDVTKSPEKTVSIQDENLSLQLIDVNKDEGKKKKTLQTKEEMTVVEKKKETKSKRKEDKTEIPVEPDCIDAIDFQIITVENKSDDITASDLQQDKSISKLHNNSNSLEHRNKQQRNHSNNNDRNKNSNQSDHNHNVNYKDRNNNHQQHDPKDIEDDADYPYPVTPDVILLSDLKKKSISELIEIATEYGIECSMRIVKHNLIYQIAKSITNSGKMLYVDGIVSVANNNAYGFIRSQEDNYYPMPYDAYISRNQISKFGLQSGDYISGYIKTQKKSDSMILCSLKTINECEMDKLGYRKDFDHLTPLYPSEKLHLDTTNPKDKDSVRMIDLISPIAKGQRGLIVAQPKTGKTTLMKQIVHAVSQNHPEIYLIVLLIDERPEEVTDMIRSTKAEVVSSNFDEPASRHVELSELIIEKAKRKVEMGMDVMIVLDSITRLARAYNNTAPSSGKVLSGGVDSNALQKPKRLFGAARNIEEGGSLTIIGTALVETGSRMEEVIFEEFKGTGNWELSLDRKKAESYIFPAINIAKSGVRNEELMRDSESMDRVKLLRRVINMDTTGNGNNTLEMLIDRIRKTKNNDDLLKNLMNN